MAIELYRPHRDYHYFSIKRAEELKERIEPYLQKANQIPAGLNLTDLYSAQKERILQYFGATQEIWDDWRWQMSHRIMDVNTLDSLFPLTEAQKNEISTVGRIYRWAVSPYYLSLMDFSNPEDPIVLQGIPKIEELFDKSGEEDPMGEALTSPAPCITRRYPDRLIINVTNMCGMYCRHCQRRRNIGETDGHKEKEDLKAALDYIRENPEIRDVLITGGDALLLSDQTIEWLLAELHSIPHVEIKRLGTRVPVTLPMRITDELLAILAKYPPIYINTQFNHPKEVTLEAKKAADKLVSTGVVLGNQAVLLKGINTDPDVMKKMNQELLKIRVRPYYLFHAKNVKGTRHFIPSIQEGLTVMEALRGFTSGLAVPTYIINAPKGGGKTPLLPQYLLSLDEHQAILKTWEGKIVYYENHCADEG
ncbi:MULTISPECIES: glutamate 2,3-aminomutase [unclassified Dehalobacter]|uniref:glutamate 2,3-aminomutase n=1 Tax=unclassified Dehalobacter TaxID=2635733 RepID=UPI000E6C1775|nr:MULTISPECIES: glutamate 2,3-aminomutase [unclassified Dehalobacter]RJE48874.1 glutamate 2,3-aminomutase [Dehalobacter sp. MCB1]TCX52037.1 glutamate 2,3-aminomutase [Dehalobacter sp. 14DCB1]TCX53111.1 glutamate 2,3-aminomutase [Dehalobacter sp. 12DCB1]